MFNSNLFKSAHKMARDIKAEYTNVDYKFQFGLCLSYLLKIEGKIKMVEERKMTAEEYWNQPCLVVASPAWDNQENVMNMKQKHVWTVDNVIESYYAEFKEARPFAKILYEGTLKECQEWFGNNIQVHNDGTCTW